MKPSENAKNHNVFVAGDTIYRGKRIITVAIDCPACIVDQVSKNRLVRQSSESSRAKNMRQTRDAVIKDPWFPAVMGKNCKGMSPKDSLPEDVLQKTKNVLQDLLDQSIVSHQMLEEVNTHKEITNRTVELFMKKRQVLTATWQGWMHYFGQRLDSHAQGDHRLFAQAIAYAVAHSTPVESMYHLPFIREEERSWIFSGHYTPYMLASVGRAGRVSYGNELKHNNIDEDAKRGAQYAKDGHWSCFEHAAIWYPTHGDPIFEGWLSYREYLLPHRPLVAAPWEEIQRDMLADQDGDAFKTYNTINNIVLPSDIEEYL